MSSYTKILITILSFMVVLTGYNYFFKPFGESSKQNSKEEKPVNEAVFLSPTPFKDEVTGLMESLDTSEKLGQLLSLPVTLSSSAAAELNKEVDAELQTQLDMIKKFKPGSIIIFGEQLSVDSVAQAISVILKLYPDKYLKPVIMVDHEGGSVQRLGGEGFSLLPSWKKLCKLASEERADYLNISAKELKDAGINIVLAPVLDLATSSSVMKERVCSGNPAQIFEASNQFISIFSSYGLLPVIKHYPGIGSASKDLHTQFTSIEVRESDVTPFDQILEKFPSLGVMSSHVGTKALNPDLPCSLSTECLRALVTTYPKTLIISDDLMMRAVSYDGTTKTYTKPLEIAAIEAIEAGNQIIIFGKGVSTDMLTKTVETLQAFYSTNETNADLINTRLKRVLELKLYQLKKE